MNPNSYCAYVAKLPAGDLNRVYHDTEYGFPLESDNALFGRLILEINQAGLSWTIILKKKQNFKKAYSQFSIEKIANYQDSDIERLLQDAGIIRNRLKINAAIYNAQQIVRLQEIHGSFRQWLESHKGLDKKAWVKLFKKTFKFTGGEITGEFLMSTGYLTGAHEEDCPVYQLLQNKA